MKDNLTTNVHSEQVAPPDAKPLLAAVVSDMDIETAAVNTYKGKDLNEQRANIDKILAFEKGAKWALSKLSNNGSQLFAALRSF
jgi:hypothetical protein